MVEKKLVVDGLRLSYNGPFDVIEFYKTVEDWMRQRGMEKEIKKKLEHITKTGKKIEWNIECWKKIGDYAKPIVRLRALFDNVKEIEIKKDKSRRKLQHGNALLIFDGFLETDIEGRWQQKPLFYFLRALFDKYIYKLWSEKHDEETRKEVYDLHKVLTDFFNMYKY